MLCHNVCMHCTCSTPHTQYGVFSHCIASSILYLNGFRSAVTVREIGLLHNYHYNTSFIPLLSLCAPLSLRPSLPFSPSLPPQVTVVRQRDKTEVFFRRLLMEDKGAGQWEGTSYIDFLCQIHRDIKDILS